MYEFLDIIPYDVLTHRYHNKINSVLLTMSVFDLHCGIYQTHLLYILILMYLNLIQFDNVADDFVYDYAKFQGKLKCLVVKYEIEISKRKNFKVESVAT